MISGVCWDGGAGCGTCLLSTVSNCGETRGVEREIEHLWPVVTFLVLDGKIATTAISSEISEAVSLKCEGSTVRAAGGTADDCFPHIHTFTAQERKKNWFKYQIHPVGLRAA